VSTDQATVATVTAATPPPPAWATNAPIWEKTSRNEWTRYSEAYFGPWRVSRVDWYFLEADENCPAGYEEYSAGPYLAIRTDDDSDQEFLTPDRCTTAALNGLLEAWVIMVDARAKLADKVT